MDLSAANLVRLVLFSLFGLVLSNVAANNVLKLKVQKNWGKLAPRSSPNGINLTDHQNIYYSGWIKLGSPGQPLRVNFDTGSADFWVLTESICIEDPKMCEEKDRKLYNPKKSSSYKPIKGNGWNISYGDGTFCSGGVSEDVFEIVGVTVTHQSFAEVKIYQGADDTYDALMGLGFPRLATSYLKRTPLENMLKQGLLKENKFAFYLNTVGEDEMPVSREDSHGELVLGGVDDAHYTGDILYTPVDDTEGFWTIHVDEVKVGNSVIGRNFNPIVDSGSTDICGSEKFQTLLLKHIGEGNAMIECSQINSLPNITFVISGNEFVLTPQYYMVRSWDPRLCDLGFEVDGERDLTVLGDVFMRQFYTVFDVGNKQLGLAIAK